MSKKTGRKREFSLEDLISIFEKHEKDFVLDNIKILRPADSFRSQLKETYSIPGKEKNIYTDAWKWNKNREANESDSSDQSSFEKTLEEEIELNSSKSFTDDSIKYKKNDIKFSIKLTNQLWKLIEPVPRSYHRRANKKKNKYSK